ncbi:MAG: PAS domain-containing protein [Ferruginibacter sp.]
MTITTPTEHLPMYNNLLQQQLRKQFGSLGNIPEELLALFKVISDSYDHYEKDRKTMERPIEFSSIEMTELNDNLGKDKDQLKELNKELKILFEGIAEVFYTIDMTSLKFLQMSAACEKVYGYTSEEFFADGELLNKLIHPEDVHIASEQMKMLYGGKKVVNQYRIINKDKNIRWLENKMIPTLDEQGRLLRLDGVTNDITERKKTEQELEESVAILETIIEATVDGILVADLNAKIITFNSKFLELWKMPKEILDSRDDTQSILFVLDQLNDPDVFLTKVKAIYADKLKSSFDYLYFKDGRIFERYSQPHLINGKCVGRVWCFRDITQQKKAETVLKTNEDHLTIASQIAKLGYWEFDVTQNMLTLNDQCYSIFKTTAEKVGGYSISSEEYMRLFVYPDDGAIVSKAASDAIKSKDHHYQYQIEHRVKYENGEIGYVAARFFVVKNDLGRTTKTFGAIQDISESKKAEEALINSELLFRTLTINAPVGIFQTDASGKTTYVNETWMEYAGFEYEEAMGDGWLSAVHPDDRALLIKIWYERSLKGLESSSEYRIIDKKGNLRWVSGRAIPLFNNLGEITGHIGTLTDITEIKNAEIVLKKSEGQLSIAAQIAKLGYWEYDVRENNFTLSDQLYSIFKTTAEKSGGYDMSPEQYQKRFVHPDDQSIIENALEVANTTTDPDFRGQVEHRIIYADGGIGYTAVRFFVVKDRHGLTIKIIGANQDITDLKNAQATLQKSEANLAIKNRELGLKNKELEQFAYMASHDLQEPLRTISSFLGLLKRQYVGKLDENADKYFSFISESSERMKALIKDLLEYSRIGRKKEFEEVDANIILRGVIADVKVAIMEADAEITSSVLPVVNSRTTELKQLFQNLVINGIKFGKKDVKPVIKISAREHPDEWEFMFQDNGIGIDPKHKERVFVIFQRLHSRSEYEGSGIGLAHCKKIVELHGGNIWIESVAGEGSSFYFTIKKEIPH